MAVQFNMYALYITGWVMETALGSMRFLLVYLVSGAVSSAVICAYLWRLVRMITEEHMEFEAVFEIFQSCAGASGEANPESTVLGVRGLHKQ